MDRVAHANAALFFTPRLTMMNLYPTSQGHGARSDDARRHGRPAKATARALRACEPRDLVCARVGHAVNDVGIWLVMFPVKDHRAVDPERFRLAVRIRGAATLSGREAFVRAVPKLVARGLLWSKKESDETLRLLAEAGGGQPQPLEEPSWKGMPTLGKDMNERDCLRLLHRAARAVARSGQKVISGSVTVNHTEAVGNPAWKDWGDSSGEDSRCVTSRRPTGRPREAHWRRACRRQGRNAGAPAGWRPACLT